MAVYIGYHVPAVAFETLRDVFGKPAVYFAVDGNIVVVIQYHQFAQAQGAGQRAGFVGNAFHQAAVAEEYIGVVIDNVQAVFIEFGSQQFFGQRHAHSIGNTLSQWAGGGFHTVGVAVFGVAGSFAVELSEVFQVINADIIATQMQQAVQQHGSMAVGEYETIAIVKLRIGRIVLQKAAPQYFCHIGHAHRCARVAGVGLLYRIGRKKTDGVCQLRCHVLVLCIYQLRIELLIMRVFSMRFKQRYLPVKGLPAVFLPVLLNVDTYK